MKEFNLVDSLKNEGWTIHESPRYAYKKLANGDEICVEFCIGDFCVGAYDEHQNLQEDKIRCDNPITAFIQAKRLEQKYK